MAMAKMKITKRRQENHLHTILAGKGVEVNTEDQAGDQSVEPETDYQSVVQTTTILIHWGTTTGTIYIGNLQKQRNCLYSLIYIRVMLMLLRDCTK